MPYLLVRHKVEDYERWKPIFDEHASVREQSGSKGGRLWRNAADPNETVVLFEWDSLENAQRFANSDDLRETMQRSGVADQPDIYFFEEVEELRAEASSRVVDWSLITRRPSPVRFLRPALHSQT
jgi:heme-degrading monooxygenase HmoA